MLSSCALKSIRHYGPICIRAACVSTEALNSNESAPPQNPADPTEFSGSLHKGIDGWQIMAAVCVTRHPVMCPPMTPLEHTYSEHLRHLEEENSILSDFELQLMEDDARKLLGDKDMEEAVDADLEQRSESALEMLDKWKRERTDFEKTRSFSCSDSPSSVGASPSKQVVLVQQYKIGSQNLWLLPQGPWKPGEALKQTCERIVAETCDPTLGVRVMGNAPIGFYKYKYPKEVRAKGYLGAKVFFYRGLVSSRVRKSLSILNGPGKQEQRWLTQQQLREHLQKSYVGAISQFLVDDS